MLELEELELLLLLKQRAGSVARGDTDTDHHPKIEAFHPEPKPPAVSGVLTS